METYNFRKQTRQYLNVLKGLLEEGRNLGLDLSPIFKKLESVTKAIDDGMVRIVLLGSFSDGKTSAIAGLLGRLESTMKIDPDESSDELVVYRPMGMREGFEIVDTPGLFGTKEKEIDGKNVKISEITEKYISEAHIVIYVCDALTPLKESHAEIIRKVLRDYKKLDSTVFVINKMDVAGYNPKNEAIFKKGTEIKKQNLISRLRDTIALTDEEEKRLNIVCICADPKSKGLDYWFGMMGEYLALSRIGDLRAVIDKVIEAKDVEYLQDTTMQSSVKDMVSSVCKEIGLVNKPVEHALMKVEASVQDLQLESSGLRSQLLLTKKEVIRKLDELKKGIIADIDGASLNTIANVVENDLGIQGKEVTFYIFKRNVNMILSECAETNSAHIFATAVKFENAYKMQEEMLRDAVGKGATFLGKQISGDQVRAIKNVVKDYNLTPWNLIKFGDKTARWLGRLGIVMAAAVEIWDWYSEYKDKEKLDTIKQELKKSINDAFSELYSMLDSDESFYKNFAPSYLDLCQVLKERTDEIQVLRDKLDSLSDYKDKLKDWYGDDIEDAEYEEI